MILSAQVHDSSSFSLGVSSPDYDYVKKVLAPYGAECLAVRTKEGLLTFTLSQISHAKEEVVSFSKKRSRQTECLI